MDLSRLSDGRLRRLIRPIVIQIVNEIVRQEIRHVMAGQKYIIDQDQINQLSNAAGTALQTVSDAATAVNAEIAGIPAAITAAVAKALADVGGGAAPVDLTATLQMLANIQGSVHNIAVAAQQAGAAAPFTPAAPVTDPASGLPVPVTAPIVSISPVATDASITPSSQAAVAGTDGTGNAPSAAAPPEVAAEAGGPSPDGSSSTGGGATSSAPQQQADADAESSSEAAPSTPGSAASDGTQDQAGPATAKPGTQGGAFLVLEQGQQGDGQQGG